MYGSTWKIVLKKRVQSVDPLWKPILDWCTYYFHKDVSLLIVLSLQIYQARPYGPCYHVNVRQIEHGRFVTQKSS